MALINVFSHPVNVGRLRQRVSIQELFERVGVIFMMHAGCTIVNLPHDSHFPGPLFPKVGMIPEFSFATTSEKKKVFGLLYNCRYSL